MEPEYLNFRYNLFNNTLHLVCFAIIKIYTDRVKDGHERIF